METLKRLERMLRPVMIVILCVAAVASLCSAFYFSFLDPRLLGPASLSVFFNMVGLLGLETGVLQVKWK